MINSKKWFLTKLCYILHLNLIHFFDEKVGAAGNSIVCFRASIPCHAIWQKQSEEREQFRRAQRFRQRKVWTQRPSRGDKLRCKILARKSAKLFANTKVQILARKCAKFIANFSATKVTSLPSLSVPLSLSLSLSHRAHLTHNIGSASPLAIKWHTHNPDIWRPKVTVFARFESGKRPAPSLLVFQLRRLSKFFTGRSTEHKKQRWWMWDIVFYLWGSFKCMIVIYQLFDTALPLWSSPDRCLAMFHSQSFSYIRTDRPSTKTSIHWLEHRGRRSQQFCEQCGHIFPPGNPITSFLSQPISAVIPNALAFNRTKPLSPRSPSSRKPSNVQLVPACVASGNIHSAVSRHLDKNCGKQRCTVFSMNKTQEGKQRSTNWRRRHLGGMQQQPRRWPGFDKSVETKLR